MINYEDKSRDWLENEKALIQDALDDIKVVSALQIIGKYDENWEPRHFDMKKDTINDLYIHVDELDQIESKIQNARVSLFSEKEKDDILCDVLQRLQKITNRKSRERKK